MKKHFVHWSFFTLLFLAAACIFSCEKETSCREQAQQIQFTELRAAVGNAHLKDENFRSALLEIVGGAEKNLADGDMAGAAGALNGLAYIVFNNENTMSGETAISVLEGVLSAFLEHHLPGIAFHKLDDLTCGGGTCSIAKPGWKCFQNANGCIAGGP